MNFNISDNYKGIIQEGNRITSLFGTALNYDSRDDLDYPLKGNYAFIDVGIAGILGGDKKYVKATTSFSNFFQIYQQLVFKTQISGGYIRSFSGHDLYPDDGFYIGGSKLRGFEFGNAGPKITNLDSSKENKLIGGNKYFIINTELRLPIIKDGPIKIFGAFFYNAGLATGIEKNVNVNLNRILDSHKIRSSCGLVITLKTPAGNIGFEFSNIISKEHYDKTESFRFSLGTDF